MPIPTSGVRWADVRLIDKVVMWDDEQGHHSRSVDDPEIFEWLAAGNEPEDPPPEPPPGLSRAEKIERLEAEVAELKNLLKNAK